MLKKFWSKVVRGLEKYLAASIVPVLLVLFVAAYLSHLIIYNIMPGEAGVKWRRFQGGTQTDYVYPEGLHLIFPWDKMYIYNIRVQQTAHEFDVLTVDGLTLKLSISIRYFPERVLLGVLHQMVGPNYVETVVIPEIEAVLRILIGRMRAEAVYTTEQAIIERSINQAVEQIAQRFVNVDNVIIKRIAFPPAIVEAIEEKMEQQQLALAYEFRVEREKKEAERKRIEAGGLKTYYDILTPSLSPAVMLWRAIQATLELAQSPNAKIVVIGSNKQGLPIIGNIPFEQFQDKPAAMDLPEPATQYPDSLDFSGNSVRETPTPETPQQPDGASSSVP